jgi:Alginate export
MTVHARFLAAALLTARVLAAESPAPSSPSLNALLRSENPALSAWDVSIAERFRVEEKGDAGTTHAGSAFDFDAAPPSANSNHYELNRVLLRAAYTGSDVSVVVEGRSSYSLGDNRFSPAAPGQGLTEDDGPVQLQMAYVALGGGSSGPLSMRIGRQELNFGDMRLIGSSPWLNTPHAFDAIDVHYADKEVVVEAFAASLVQVDGGSYGSRFERSDSGDIISGVYVDAPGLVKAVTNQAYVIARNVNRSIVTDYWLANPAPFRFPAPQDLYTLGVRSQRVSSASSPWGYGIEAMLQLGDRTAVFPSTSVAAAKAAPRLNQRSWALVAQLSYAWKAGALDPRLALIMSAASGDKDPKDGSSQTFQNLLPSNHGLYGLMDLTSLQNIVDARLSASIKPLPALRLAVDFHDQSLQSTSDYWYNVAGVPRVTPGAAAGSGRGFGINPGYSHDLGREADLTATWTIAKGLRIDLGAGHFFRGDYVRQSFSAVGSHDAQYGYGQATVEF